MRAREGMDFMAEIKSAIELAMERTKNLVMDEKEKQAFARREIEERARAIIRRYAEGIIDRETFLVEYGSINAQKAEKRSIVMDIVIEEFNASAENERLFEILEMVGEEVGGPFGDQVKALKREFRKDLEKRATGIKMRVKERLEAMGIKGSSVEPNVAEWEEWKDAVQEIGSLFKGRLNEWKDSIKTVQG